MIQKKAGGRTEAQRLRLADGLRDLDVDHILAELKITESLNEKTLIWLSLYDALYRESAKLKRHQLRSVLISSKTPGRKFIDRFFFKPVGPVGVYQSTPTWGGVLRLIVLNELADEPQNAPLKCFSSRPDQRRKAFETIKSAGLLKLSVSLGQIIVGIWRSLMKGALNNLEMEGITPEYAIQLGKEWFESMVDTTPDEELFSLPKFEHRLLRERQDGEQNGERKGRQEGEAAILLKLIHRKFGQVPDEITEKVTSAKLELIETWAENILFADSLDDVFAS